MTEMERIHDQLRKTFSGPAWHGPSLMELLQDLSGGEARARPVAAAHSIGELVRHLLAWRNLVIHRLRGEDGYQVTGSMDWPVGPADDLAWSEDMEALRASQREILLLLGRFNPALLDAQAPGSDVTWHALFHGILQHDLYHLGQVGLLKKALRS